MIISFLLLCQMDRASILGDAVDYLEELLRRINDLYKELESARSSALVAGPAAASFHPHGQQSTVSPFSLCHEV
jgi:hypothetical protein